MTLSFILVLLLFMRIVVVNPPLNNNHGAPAFVSPKGFCFHDCEASLRDFEDYLQDCEACVHDCED